MIQVCCAIIESEGKILVAQRGEDMRHPYKWEFPGGKIEHGESPEECIKREIHEELAIEIVIVEQLPPVVHAYPDFQICLIPFKCIQKGGYLVLKEHHAIKWVLPHELRDIDLSAADIGVVGEYLGKYHS